MSNLIFIFLCFLPWGGFLFRHTGLDVWHAEGHYVQIGILILFSYSFFEKPKNIQPINRSLGSFFLWAGLVTGYWWLKVLGVSGNYPSKIFYPLFNLLCIVVLYKLIVDYLDKVDIERILKWLKYSIVIFLFYSVLQYLKLDEFFTGIDDGGAAVKGIDQLVGTIGNPSHLAGLLAIIQPLFFKKSRENILTLILIWLLIYATSSASGILTGMTVIIFWLFFKKPKLALISLGLGIFSLITLFITNRTIFDMSTRFEVWKVVFPVFSNKAITGSGLGSFGLLGINRSGHWQHLHCEYFQIAFELGLVGLSLAIWCIYDYFKLLKNKCDLNTRIASIFFGFCFINLVTFFGHLWITSVLGIMSFAFLYALKAGEK